MKKTESEQSEGRPGTKQNAEVPVKMQTRQIDRVQTHLAVETKTVSTNSIENGDYFKTRAFFERRTERRTVESTTSRQSAESLLNQTAQPSTRETTRPRRSSDHQAATSFPQPIKSSDVEGVTSSQIRPIMQAASSSPLVPKTKTDDQPAMKMKLTDKEISRIHLEELEDSITKSTDNLLRQTLSAVQVLNMLPKARKRNPLNSEITAHSLLDEVELRKVLPFKEVSIHVATWNMNGKEPPQCPKSWLLPEGITDVSDIIVVGTQESYPEEDDWEIMLQVTIGQSHVMYHATTFGTLHMAIFIRRELVWFLSVADEDTHSVRMTTFRTKGAIAVAFYVFGTTFLFMTSHLTAHEEKLKERYQDIRHIVKGLKLPHKLPCRHRDKDVTDNFDYVFWSGDLNFRLTSPRSEVIDWVSSNNFPLTEPAPSGLGDQLIRSIEYGSILHGFEEGPLTFAPTYKFDTGTSTYDTSSKQRTPSYTDRILYKTNRVGPDAAVKCTGYGSVHSVCTSDHKPVWGRYKCPIQPGMDAIPLNAGLFNREVYLDAIKRRAKV